MAGPEGTKGQGLKVFALRSPLFYKTVACGSPTKPKKTKDWGFSLCNLNKAFSKRLPHAAFPYLFWHGAYFLTKQAYGHTWTVFTDEMHRVSAHRFRFYEANVQPVILVMNVAVALGHQRLDAQHFFNGYGAMRQSAFLEDMAKGFDAKGFCQRNATTFYHQALAKSSPAIAISFCRAAAGAFSVGLNPAASACFCAARPFGSKCTWGLSLHLRFCTWGPAFLHEYLKSEMGWGIVSAGISVVYYAKFPQFFLSWKKGLMHCGT